MKSVGTAVMFVASASSRSSRTRPATSAEMRSFSNCSTSRPRSWDVDDVGRPLVVLVVEDRAREIEESALRRCGLGCFGACERVGVDLLERGVAPHVAEPVAEFIAHFEDGA